MAVILEPTTMLLPLLRQQPKPTTTHEMALPGPDLAVAGGPSEQTRQKPSGRPWLARMRLTPVRDAQGRGL